MNVYKTKGFARFARQERMDDRELCEAVDRAERGLIDANLGGGVIKQRLPRPGQGRSGGFRVIVFYRSGKRSVFVDGFAKSDQENIDSDDLDRFRHLAAQFLAYDAKAVRRLLEAGAWIEIECDDR